MTEKVKKDKRKGREDISEICSECNEIFIMTRDRIKTRLDKYGKHLCRSCSRKGNRNPFYGRSFDKEQISNFSDIRKEWYNDEELGEARRKSQSIMYTGSNNPMFKGAIYKRETTWRNYNFRYLVLKRDNCTCVKCGVRKEPKSEMKAHHLNGYNWHIEGRLDVNNGVTLCNECHLRFHKAYGKGQNTKEQFYQFMNEGSTTIESII